MQNASQELQTTLTDFANTIGTMYAVAGTILSGEWSTLSIDDRVEVIGDIVDDLRRLQPLLSAIHPPSGLNALQQAVFLSRAQGDAPTTIDFAAAVSAVTLRLNHNLISLAQLQARPVSTGDLLGLLQRLQADVRYTVAIEGELLRHSLENSAHLLYQTAYRLAYEAHTMLAVECAIQSRRGDDRAPDRLQSRKLFEHAAAILISSVEMLATESPAEDDAPATEQTDADDNNPAGDTSNIGDPPEDSTHADAEQDAARASGAGQLDQPAGDPETSPIADDPAGQLAPEQPCPEAQ